MQHHISVCTVIFFANVRYRCYGSKTVRIRISWTDPDPILSKVRKIAVFRVFKVHYLFWVGEHTFTRRSGLELEKCFFFTEINHFRLIFAQLSVTKYSLPVQCCIPPDHIAAQDTKICLLWFITY